MDARTQELLILGPNIDGYTVQYCLNPSQARESRQAVYVARDVHNQKVMIKMALDGVGVSHERNILNALNDCPTPTVLAEHSGEGYHALVLNHIAGDTLLQRFQIAHIEPFSSQELLGWGLNLAQSVQAIHQAGVHHLDLKPDNIILKKDGVALIDFECAQCANVTTVPTPTHNKARYRHPNITNPAQQDVYALTTLLHDGLQLAEGMPYIQVVSQPVRKNATVPSDGLPLADWVQALRQTLHTGEQSFSDSQNT